MSIFLNLTIFILYLYASINLARQAKGIGVTALRYPLSVQFSRQRVGTQRRLVTKAMKLKYLIHTGRSHIDTYQHIILIYAFIFRNVNDSIIENNQIINFTLYHTHKGNLVLRHSVPHFPPNSARRYRFRRSITC